MKVKSILFLVLLIASINSANAQFSNVTQISSGSTSYQDWIKDVSGDGTGTNYICGRFHGTITIGTQTATAIGGSGDDDYFVAKMNSNGTCAWLKRIGNDLPQTGVIQVCVAGGFVYVSGGFSGNIDVGGGSTSSSLPNNFIVKYNTSGGFQWVMNFATNLLPSSCAITGLAVATNGIYAIYNDGAYNGGMLKVDILSHTYSWKVPFTMQNVSGVSSNMYNRPYDITVDNSNGIYVCGSYKAMLSNNGSATCQAAYRSFNGTGGITFNITVNNTGINPVWETNMFFVKFDYNGIYKWGKSYGTPKDLGGCFAFGDEATGVVYNANQNCLFLTGEFTGSTVYPAQFDAIQLVPIGGASKSDIFLSRITTAGAVQWVVPFGGTDCEAGGSITSDNAGNVYLTGLYFTKFSLGCYSATNIIHDPGTLIAKFTSGGRIQWMTNIEILDIFYNPADGGNYNVACDNIGNAYSVLNAFSMSIYPAGYGILNATGVDALYSKVRPLTVAYAGPDVNLCCGPVQIGAAGSGLCTYSWSPTTGLSNANIANPICTKAGTYTLTCHFGTCTTTDQVIVGKATAGCCRIGQFENADISTSEIEYNIYPNPSSANTSFFIESNNIDEVNDRKISVYSIDGSLVMKRDLIGSATEEVKHNLSPGMYVIIIQSAGDVQKFKLTIVE